MYKIYETQIKVKKSTKLIIRYLPMLVWHVSADISEL